MLGAASALEQAIDGVEVDAVVGRQVSAAIDLIASLRQSGELAPVVVISLGNNGTFTSREFDGLMAVLADAREVVFANVRVPRDWQDRNNQVIADGVSRYPNAVLVDWYGASADHPEYFWDGIHLRPVGAAVYASLISAAIAGQ